MKIVAIDTLKKDLSEYLFLAKEGERILISDGNEIVAELRPPSGAGAYVPSNPDQIIFEESLNWKGVSAVDALNSTREDRE